MDSITIGINNMDNLEGHASRKGETACLLSNGWTEITTPYLDPYNDYIQIYLKQTEDGFLLTDSGATLSLLEESGTLGNPKKEKCLKAILAQYGVAEQNGNLQAKATAENFTMKKHALILAILYLNDMSHQSI